MGKSQICTAKQLIKLYALNSAHVTVISLLNGRQQLMMPHLENSVELTLIKEMKETHTLKQVTKLLLSN